MPRDRRKSGSQRPPQKIARDDRRYTKEDRPKDQRREFQRDRDRVLYSSAFRRLAGVTQVVHAAEGHIFHNRLTHSLKVAQTGRRIAEHLVDREHEDLLDAIGGIDPDVVETAGMIHDIGHPPFGHIAETVLDQRLIENGVLDGFEGNPQSFRIVTKVAIRNPKHPGLNLTRATLNAILKYPWERGVAGKHQRKWGCYFSETEDFRFARSLRSVGDFHQSPEATIMDWADDVAYSVHDVDDFYRAGLIPLDQLIVGTDELRRFIEGVHAKWRKNGDSEQITRLNESFIKDFFAMRLKELTEDQLSGPFSGNRKQRATLNWLSAVLIKRYIVGLEGEVKAVQVSDTKTEHAIKIEPEFRAEVDVLKELMWFYVFENPALVAQQYGQRKVVEELFDVFFEATDSSSSNSGIIPQPFRDFLDQLDRTGLRSDIRERARLAADIIAYMTEQQCLTLYQRVKGFAPGSVQDLIIR